MGFSARKRSQFGWLCTPGIARNGRVRSAKLGMHSRFETRKRSQKRRIRGRFRWGAWGLGCAKRTQFADGQIEGKCLSMKRLGRKWPGADDRKRTQFAGPLWRSCGGHEGRERELTRFAWASILQAFFAGAQTLPSPGWREGPVSMCGISVRSKEGGLRRLG